MPLDLRAAPHRTGVPHPEASEQGVPDHRPLDEVPVQGGRLDRGGLLQLKVGQKFQIVVTVH